MKLRKIRYGPVLILGIVLFVAISVANLEQARRTEDLQQLEQALHRTAVACYATEGVYPPDVAYMKEHYGLTYDENRYAVHYDLFASNIMPKINVIER